MKTYLGITLFPLCGKQFAFCDLDGLISSKKTYARM